MTGNNPGGQDTDSSVGRRSSSVAFPHLVFALILATGLSFAVVAGGLYDRTSFLSFSRSDVAVFIVLACVFAGPLYFLLVKATDAHSGSEPSLPLSYSSRDKWVAIAAISVPQLILWLVAWPGVYNHDAPFQILQLNSTTDNPVPLGNKYSVLYSILLGGAVCITRPLGVAEVGFAAVMLVQMVIVIYAQYKAVEYIWVTAGRKWLYWASVLFFAINPFGIIMRMTACQDTLFAAFLLLSIIEALHISERACSGRALKLKDGIRFVAFVVLMCLMRNNGVYLYAFAVLCASFFFLKRKRMDVLGLIVSPILITLIIVGPVYKAVGVVDSGSSIREMMSVPSQQLARSYANNQDGFTEDEKNTLEHFYPGITADDASWYWDGQEISDQAKGRLSVEAVNGDLPGYIGFYVHIGVKNIGNYRDAFMMNTLGWWYPLKEYPDWRMYHAYVKYSTLQELDYDGEFVEIKRISLFPELDKAVGSIISNGEWSKVPVLNLLLDTGAYTWIFLTLLVIALLGKKRYAGFAFLIVLGLLLTYLLSPLCYFRYSYALIICIPVLLPAALYDGSESIDSAIKSNGALVPMKENYL